MSAHTEGIIRCAATAIEEGRRIDLSELAAEMHISRVTLFRHAGNRDRIMAEALWWLSERSLAASAARWRRANGAAARNRDGTLRSAWIITDHGARTVRDVGFQKLLAEEPIAAMRALTDPAGAVQSRLIPAFRELLDRDVREVGLHPAVDLDTLAYAVVRLGDSMLYSELSAGRESNIDTASTLVIALVEGVLREA